MGLRLQLVNLGLRLIGKPFLRAVSDPYKVRRGFARMVRWGLQPVPYSTIVADKSDDKGENGVIWWVHGPNPLAKGVILYFHGGGYIAGSGRTHSALASKLAQLTGLRICLPDYRLAPENPFPAAVEDALSAYQALISRGYRSEDIVLGGDSAGGGLMFGLLHLILAKDMPVPAAVFAFSPWTDLSLQGESLARNAAADPLLPGERIEQLRSLYLNDHTPDNPEVSPVFGDYTGAPPALLQVGITEILLDDSRRIAKKMVEQGVSADLQIWQNVPHVWHLFFDHLNEAQKALEATSEFIGKHISPTLEPTEKKWPRQDGFL